MNNNLQMTNYVVDVRQISMKINIIYISSGLLHITSCSCYRTSVCHIQLPRVMLSQVILQTDWNKSMFATYGFLYRHLTVQNIKDKEIWIFYSQYFNHMGKNIDRVSCGANLFQFLTNQCIPHHLIAIFSIADKTDPVKHRQIIPPF